MNYNEAINFIHSTYKFGSKLGLDNIKRLTELLGNPQDSFKIIHVAGTNGKGSTSNLIHDVLMASGYKTGLFISPYLEEFTERIQINKTHIDKESLSRITSLIKEKIEIMIKEGYNHPTEFEVVTALGFKYFEEQKIDFLILEVGLGGRFDATNVVKNTLISVITSISYDHMQYLGDTLEKIAFEKAGIIKTNSNVVIYPQSDEIKNVIKQIAFERDTRIHEVNASDYELISSDLNGQIFKYLKTDVFNLNDAKINLLGEHQILNSLTVLRVLEILKNLGYNITECSIKEGFLSCRFQGRFEIVNQKPLIILDGGHNINGIEYFSKAINKYFKDKKIILFYGMLEDKNPEDVIDYLTSLSKEIYTLTPDNPRAMKAVEMAELIKKHSNIKVTPLSDTNEIIHVLKTINKDEVVAFVGSLYMIGGVRTILRKSEFFDLV